MTTLIDAEKTFGQTQYTFLLRYSTSRNKEDHPQSS